MLVDNFDYDARLEPFIKAFDDNMFSPFKKTKPHPMAMMSTLISVFSSFYPEANPAFVG